ncbi:MAG: superoxide dismutase family protein [Polyangiaceae bacterium]|nr:superoxide dismutase family protein [Polyangiaceae bacterium]
MTSLRIQGLLIALAIGSAAVASVSCSDDAGTGGTGGGTGGKPSVGTGGAAQASGGKASASGGAASASGGAASASGGAASASGGAASASGGAASASGGAASASGGAASASGGAASASGGAASASGGAASGGAASGGTPNAGGTGGGGSANPVAIATITAVDGSQIAGTATFTQVGNTVTLVIALTNCPAGPHASHLHLVKDCGGTAAANAGGHWQPNGENLGNYTCADGVGTHEVSKATTTWTVGGGDTDTDVTQFSFMVHAAGDPQAGAKIACGLINLQ